jgi:hypothetical protein
VQQSKRWARGCRVPADGQLSGSASKLPARAPRVCIRWLYTWQAVLRRLAGTLPRYAALLHAFQWHCYVMGKELLTLNPNSRISVSSHTIRTGSLSLCKCFHTLTRGSIVGLSFVCIFQEHTSWARSVLSATSCHIELELLHTRRRLCEAWAHRVRLVVLSRAVVSRVSRGRHISVVAGIVTVEGRPQCCQTNAPLANPKNPDCAQPMKVEAIRHTAMIK